jgi:hypothetical protein
VDECDKQSQVLVRSPCSARRFSAVHAIRGALGGDPSSCRSPRLSCKLARFKGDSLARFIHIVVHARKLKNSRTASRCDPTAYIRPPPFRTDRRAATARQFESPRRRFAEQHVVASHRAEQKCEDRQPDPRWGASLQLRQSMHFAPQFNVRSSTCTERTQNAPGDLFTVPLNSPSAATTDLPRLCDAPRGTSNVRINTRGRIRYMLP